MGDNSNANRRVARNSILLSVRLIFVLAISLYTTRVILKILGIEDYGVFNVVCGFVSMFAFLNTSMSNGIQRFYNYEYGKSGVEGAKKIFVSSIYIQGILSIIIIVLAESIGLWYLNTKMVIPAGRQFAANCIFQASLGGFVLSVMQAPFTAAVMAHEKLDFYALMSLVDALLKLLIVIVLPLFSGDKLIIYGLLITAIGFFDLLFYYIYTKSKFEEITMTAPICKNKIVEMLNFSGWNIFGSLSSIIKEQGINLVLNFFGGPIINAARGVAVQVSSGLQSFVFNLTIPVRPQVIQSYAQDNYKRTMQLTFAVSKLSCFFLYFLSLPIFYEIDFILNLWLGNNIPEYTSHFVRIVILTSFISNLNNAVSGVVHASGKMRLYQISGGFWGILSLPLAYMFLKMGFSPVIAFWAVFTTSVISQFFALLILKQIVDYSIRKYFRKVLFPLFLVVILTVFIPLIPHTYMHEGLFRLIIVTILSIISTSIAVYLWGLDKNERYGIINIIQNIFKIKK